MATTLIAVIVALVLGHLAPGLAAAVRRYDWYTVWTQWLGERFPGANSIWDGGYGVFIALLPPLVLIALFQAVLHTPLAGVVGMLFGVVVLFYAWGPRDLDSDVTKIVDAEDAASQREAVAALGVSATSGTNDGGALVEAVFGQALRRWFGVLFWFLLLGPVGALLYRLSSLSAEDDTAANLHAAHREGAQRLFAVLNWPVAQLMTLSLALVGNFDTVIGAWKDTGGSAFSLDQPYLGAAARASVRSEVAEEAQEFIEEGETPGDAWALLGELPELRDAMSLVWRILLLWMAVLALFVVAGWVS